MITKIYELTKMNSAYLSTKYCGVVVDIPFTSGRGSSGTNRAEFVTTDKFTQDAIEHDPRFGRMFVLAQEYKDDEEIAKEKLAAEKKAEEEKKEKTAKQKETDELVAEVKAKELERLEKAEKKAAAKAKKEKEENIIVVNDVTSLNDAFDFFANKGIVIENKDQLKQTMKELGYSFPNLQE